ncbi:3939_t:CDS:2 [Entrophospora sp. SA101]|nr:3939_t:CDS:2 [Entrophospora sp. SA101]
MGSSAPLCSALAEPLSINKIKMFHRKKNTKLQRFDIRRKDLLLNL